MKNKFTVLCGLLLVLVLTFSACAPKEEPTTAAPTTEAPVTTSNQPEVVTEEEPATEESTEAKMEEVDVYNGEEGKITVYVSGPAKMIEKLEEKFEEERGDVLDIYHAGCGPLRQKVWAESEAGNLQADVFWGSNPLIYYALQEKGDLEDYQSEEIANTKDEFILEGANFALTSARYEVIVYNNETLTPEIAPKSYAALCDAEWKNRMAYTDLSQSSTAFALSTALWNMFDNTPAFFDALKENEALIVPKSKEVAEKIQSGEIEVGIVPYDAIFRLQKKAKKEEFESKLAPMWPEDGAIQIERPIAIIKNNSRPEVNEELAREFVDFILSKPAQEIMAKFGFTTVRTDVENVEGIPADLVPTIIDWKELEKSEQMIRDAFKDALLGN